MSTPPTAPPPAPSAEALARQVRLFKGLAAALLVLLLAGAGVFLYQRRLGQPVTVRLDGVPVTTVRNAADAERLLNAAAQSQAGPAYPTGSLVYLQKVTLQRVAGDTPLDTDAAARAKLRRALKLHVRAYVILVNGRPSVGLPSDREAVETVRRVKDHFANMPPPTQILSAQVVERVQVVPRAIDASRARASAAQAAAYFWTPPPAKTYVVRPGDLGGRIAARNHLSLTDLILVNPGKNLNRLKPGDVLNVQKMPLLLTVRVQKKQTRDEPIIAHAPAGSAGLRRVVYRITYTNGQETYREPLSMVTIERPRARMSL